MTRLPAATLSEAFTPIICSWKLDRIGIVAIKTKHALLACNLEVVRLILGTQAISNLCTTGRLYLSVSETTLQALTRETEC